MLINRNVSFLKDHRRETKILTTMEARHGQAFTRPSIIAIRDETPICSATIVLAVFSYTGWFLQANYERLFAFVEYLNTHKKMYIFFSPWYLFEVAL